MFHPIHKKHTRKKTTTQQRGSSPKNKDVDSRKKKDTLAQASDFHKKTNKFTPLSKVEDPVKEYSEISSSASLDLYEGIDKMADSSLVDQERVYEV